MARLISSLGPPALLFVLSGGASLAQDAAEPDAGAGEAGAGDEPRIVLEPGEPTASLEPDEALILPPTLSEQPGAVRLEPQPEEREEALEVVVVRGTSDWRLPDLGSDLRAQREAEARANQRIDVAFLRLYDPENEDPSVAVFDEPDPRGVGWIKLFEVGFGRPRD